MSPVPLQYVRPKQEISGTTHSLNIAGHVRILPSQHIALKLVNHHYRVNAKLPTAGHLDLNLTSSAFYCQKLKGSDDKLPLTTSSTSETSFWPFVYLLTVKWISLDWSCSSGKFHLRRVRNSLLNAGVGALMEYLFGKPFVSLTSQLTISPNNFIFPHCSTPTSSHTSIFISNDLAPKSLGGLRSSKC